MRPSLFEPRGGSLMAHICESCNEPIDHDSRFPLCPNCLLVDPDEEVES